MQRKLGFLLFVMVTLGAQGADLRVGRGSVKITPPAGMPMAGYYRVRLSDGVHDDLYAKTLLLDRDGVQAALVACDLVGIPRPIIDAARRRITETTGIPGDHVMISATHCHTGPELGTRLTGVDEKTMRLAHSYLDSLPGRIAQSVQQAKADLQAAELRAAVGQDAHLSFIRRFLMKDGTVGWNPGKHNPNIVHPMGTIDPDVQVVYFETPEPGAKPLATYVNFAMHLDTVGGTFISADYPYTLGRLLAAVKGPEMLTEFTIGTAGNINHIDVKSSDPQKGNAEAARIGTILAGDVLKAFSRLRPVEAGPLEIRSETVEIPLASYKPSDVEKARKVVAAYGTPGAYPFYDQVYAFKVLDLDERHGKPIEAEVQVISLGDQIAWVGLPGEIFVELGKAIKVSSPFPYTIIAELANGSIGYVPDLKAYPEGAYEVVNTRCAPGGGERMADAATRLLIDAHKAAHAIQAKAEKN
jgi:hypothetical protein